MDQGPVKPSFNSLSSNGPSYVNRRGKRVTLQISKHAFSRFRERWRNLFPDKPLQIHDIERVMMEWFQQASRLEEPSGKLRIRLKRHGKDTLYFKTQHFTFVVQDATIVTVEISDKNRRHLNRHQPACKPLPSTPVGAAPAGEERPGKDEVEEKRKAAMDASGRLDPWVSQKRGSSVEKTDAHSGQLEAYRTAIDPPVATKRGTLEFS